MARPVTNKIREYIVKIKRKNGDVYVLQRQSLLLEKLGVTTGN